MAIDTKYTAISNDPNEYDGEALNSAKKKVEDKDKQQKDAETAKGNLNYAMSNDEVQAQEIMPNQQQAADAVKIVPTSLSSVFYVDVIVFLEGVQVPHNGCSVSYGIEGPSTASIVIPAAQFLRSIPQSTKVLICFKDFCRKIDEPEAKYRVLFEGEIDSTSYDITPSGANLMITASSIASYLNYMQLSQQSMDSTIYNHAAYNIGDVVFMSTGDPAQNKMSLEVLTSIINQNSIKRTADIAYRILKIMLSYGHEQNFVVKPNVAVWYYNKLGPTKCGYNILERIFNVSPEAQQASVALKMDPYSASYATINVDSNGVNGGTAGGANGGVGTNNSSVQAGSGTTRPTASNSYFIWPLIGIQEITSDWGAHESFRTKAHQGIDIAVPAGTNVIAPADGVIEGVGPGTKADGYRLQIRHKNGILSHFSHISSWLKSTGDVVKQGDVVALSGGIEGAPGAGSSTGPHLHWMCFDTGGNPVSPRNWLIETTITTDSKGYVDPSVPYEEIVKLGEKTETTGTTPATNTK